MNLRHLDQKVDLERGEANALKQSLEQYLYHLAQLSALGRLSTDQALRIKPITRLLNRLTRLLAGKWPHGGRLYLPRPRKWLLEFDELLLLRALYVGGDLPDEGVGTAQRMEIWHIMGKVDQKAQNLTTYFSLQ